MFIGIFKCIDLKLNILGFGQHICDSEAARE